MSIRGLPKSRYYECLAYMMVWKDRCNLRTLRLTTIIFMLPLRLYVGFILQFLRMIPLNTFQSGDFIFLSVIFLSERLIAMSIIVQR